MQDTELFQLALGLISLWLVDRCELDPDPRRLDICIDFSRAGKLTCYGCDREGCKICDTVEKEWRNLNYFEQVTHIHARIPRTSCPPWGIGIVSVPGARAGSGFTLLFESFVMTLARDMPVKAITRLIEEHDTRLWRILRYYVDQVRSEQDNSDATRFGVDEASGKKKALTRYPSSWTWKIHGASRYPGERIRNG